MPPQGAPSVQPGPIDTASTPIGAGPEVPMTVSLNSPPSTGTQLPAAQQATTAYASGHGNTSPQVGPDPGQ